MKKWFSYLVVSVGSLCTLIGVALVYAYFQAAVFSRLGESDQSLIFWYLPFLLFGLIGVFGGLVLLVRGTRKLRHGASHGR